MILDQSSHESLQVFLWRGCWKCQDVRYPSLDAMEVAMWFCHHFIANTSRQAGVILSWCKAPTLWCKIFFSFCKKLKHLLLSLVLPILTFSILLLCKCEDDFHLEYHASNQHKDSLKFVVEKHFDHHRRCISLQTLTVYQSPVLYTWTMLHDHLVDFSPIHVCWCLHFSELLAGILSSSKTLKPLQLFHHSMPAPSLFLHLSRSDCLPAKGAKVIGSLSLPLGPQSHSKWKTLRQLRPQLLLGL